MSTCLSAKNLSFAYTRAQKILSRINFNFHQGEVIGIFGENGVGKSTLLKILSTSLSPDEGQLSVDGKNCFLDRKAYRNSLSWLPGEGSGFFSRLSGKENLQLFFNYRNEETFSQESLKAWMNFEGFQKAYASPFYLCSSGMKQALSLYRCLSTKADLYFLDEPTRYLDKNIKQNLILEIQRKQKESIQVIASHDEDFLKKVSTRIIGIKGGQLVVSP